MRWSPGAPSFASLVWCAIGCAGSAAKSTAGSTTAPPSPSAPPAVSVVAAVDTAPATVHPIHWRWKGTYVFRERGTGPCTGYRFIIGDCPGACEVELLVDVPPETRRFRGTGSGTPNRYELEVRSKEKGDGRSAGDLRVTLEFLPGDNVGLHFGAIPGCQASSLLVSKAPAGVGSASGE